MRNLAADEDCMQHAGQLEIGDELSRSREEPLVFATEYGLTDEIAFRFRHAPTRFLGRAYSRLAFRLLRPAQPSRCFGNLYNGR